MNDEVALLMNNESFKKLLIEKRKRRYIYEE